MNRQSPAISIIVAVYKAEAYLHRCVDSLLAQTFTDFEILLIDDGSPDRSGEICDEYATKDNRIRVIHKENGGVSSARQCGIDNARGEYTIHADPDDWVEPDMLEELYSTARKEHADMVICDFYEHLNNQTNRYECKPTSLDHHTVLHELFQQLLGSCCNKLVKRACYSEHNIKFPKDFSCGEDLMFNAQILMHPIKVCYLGKAFYHYERSDNPNSIVKNSVYDKQQYINKIHFILSLFKDEEFRFIKESSLKNIIIQSLLYSDFSYKTFIEIFGPVQQVFEKSRHTNSLFLFIIKQSFKSNLAYTISQTAGHCFVSLKNRNLRLYKKIVAKIR